MYVYITLPKYMYDFVYVVKVLYVIAFVFVFMLGFIDMVSFVSGQYVFYNTRGLHGDVDSISATVMQIHEECVL